jgi:hypothetical protein
MKNNLIQTSLDSKEIRILKIIFENGIQGFEIPAFRAAVSTIAGFENILFHNHQGNKLRYSYPLIQYKRLNGKPVILCLDEGVNEVHHFFGNIQEGLKLGERDYELKIKAVNLDTAELKITDKGQNYAIQNWLPLNQENFQRYKRLNNEFDKIEFLEKY